MAIEEASAIDEGPAYGPLPVCSRVGKVPLNILKKIAEFPSEVMHELHRVVLGQHRLDRDNLEKVVSSYKLTGYGEAHHNCGEITAELSCKVCGDPEQNHKYIKHCDRAVCPICWRNWLMRLTEVASERLAQLMDQLVKRDSRYQMHHVTFSPSQELHGLPMEELKKRLLKVLKMQEPRVKGESKKEKDERKLRNEEQGSKAGASAFHAFRFKDKSTGERVDWTHCSLNPDAEEPIVDSVAHYSPHFHMLSVGYLMPADEFHDQFPDWTYTKFDERKNKEEIAGTLWYILSHAGIKDDRHALTYYGWFSYNNVSSIKEVGEWTPILCTSCENQLTKVIIKGKIVDGHLVDYEEPADYRPVTMTYTLKKPRVGDG